MPFAMAAVVARARAAVATACGLRESSSVGERIMRLGNSASSRRTWAGRAGLRSSVAEAFPQAVGDNGSKEAGWVALRLLLRDVGGGVVLVPAACTTAGVEEGRDGIGSRLSEAAAAGCPSPFSPPSFDIASA
jgi:hypothetical protein